MSYHDFCIWESIEDAIDTQAQRMHCHTKCEARMQESPVSAWIEHEGTNFPNAYLSAAPFSHLRPFQYFSSTSGQGGLICIGGNVMQLRRCIFT